MGIDSQTAKGHASEKWALNGTLFLSALCTLLVEILLTRVLSVVMWYHFTFAVISIALLGIAAGAMRCYRQFPRSALAAEAAPAFWQEVSTGLNLFSLAVALPILLMSVFIETPTYSWRGAWLLACYFIACAAPFYASGYVTTAIFRFGSGRISSLYAVDLVGASLGCLASIPLLNLLGGIGSLLMVSVLTAAAATLVARRSGNRSRLGVALATLLAFATILVIQVRTARVDLRTVKVTIREEVLPILEVKWNSHSRLAMVDYFDPAHPGPVPVPLTWGLSDRYHGMLPRQYLITIDGASETPVTALPGPILEHEYLAWDITSLPYHLRTSPKTLIIGAGGGRDVLTALWFGSTDVTGVELNRDIARWVQGPYADFAGHLYSRPEVHLVVDDGRNFVRASPEKFDILQISMIDTFAATAAGAYTLSENNLYTAQAFDEYLDHLKDGGILAINRFFLDPPQQTLRVVTLAREALARRGVKDPAQNLAVIRKRNPWDANGLVMIKTEAITSNEREAIRGLCDKMGFDVIALPGEEVSNFFTSYLREADPQRFYQDYPFDVRPPTDDWPFFFNTFKVSTFGDALSLRERVESIRVYNYDAVFILFVLLVLACVSLLLFLVVPLLRWGRSSGEGGPRLPWRQLLYFVWVGLGFILVEVVLIQRYHLFLGHPVYSLAVILVSLLAFSGLGSALTTPWSEARLSRHQALACAAVFLLVLAFEGLWPLVLNRTLGLPLEYRIAVAVLSLAPIGIAMGMPYPLGLRSVAQASPDGLPWVWAVNAAASVLGSILAFAMAMVVGFRSVLLMGGLCYLAALASSWALRPVRKGAVA